MMILAPGYDYTAVENDKGITITLFSLNGPERKEFFSAAASLEGIHRFMVSLTDSQCEQHLSIKTHVKKEKK